MHLQWNSQDAVDLPEDVLNQLKELVGNLPPWRIVRSLKVWGDINMRYDAPSTLPLELAVVEICEDTAPPPSPPVPATAMTTAAPSPGRTPAPSPAPNNTQPAAKTSQSPRSGSVQQRRPAPDAAPISELGTQWLAAVKVLGRHKGKKYNLGALLRDCKANAVSLDANTLVLGFSNKANLERMQEEMEDPGSRRQVSEAVTNVFGATYELRLTMANNGATSNTVKTAQQSSLVRTALGMGARVLEEIEE